MIKLLTSLLILANADIGVADTYKDLILKSVFTQCLSNTKMLMQCRCFIKEYGNIYNEDDTNALIEGDKEFLKAKMKTPLDNCFGNPPPPFPNHKPPTRKLPPSKYTT